MLREREAQITRLEEQLTRDQNEANYFTCRNLIINELLEQTRGQIQEQDLDKLLAKYTDLVTKEEAHLKTLDAKVNRFYSLDRFM